MTELAHVNTTDIADAINRGRCSCVFLPGSIGTKSILKAPRLRRFGQTLIFSSAKSQPGKRSNCASR